MGIQYDQQKAQEGAHPSIYDQDTIAQPIGPPMQPPPRPPQPSRGKRDRWFLVGAFIVLVLVLVLGSVFAVQLANRLATQPTPAPTVAATATPAPTGAPTPTPVPTRVPTPTPAPPAGVYQPISALWMSDATTGWARTTTQRILRTTDGGKTWQDITPSYPAGSTSEVPPAFTSLSGNLAWVATLGKQQPDGTMPNVVFRTSDGGRTWQQATLPTSMLGVSQVQFVNAQDGWVLASLGGGTAGSEAVNLFRSIDGGQTWSLVARAPGALPFQGSKSGMSWISATTGWITGTTAIPNTIYLYRTQDGGVSWQAQALSSSFPVLATQPPVFFSAIEGVLPVTVSALKGPVVSLYTTHDGGATWIYTTMIPVGSAWNFLTMQQGWAVGANGTTLFETSNGGQLWTMITPSANFRHITRLDFVSAHEGWALSNATPAAPVLLKTIDGGQTWVQVSSNPTPFSVSRVDLTVSPNNIAGRSCGSAASFAYLATFHIPAGTLGGTIHFSYTLNNGRSQTFATVAVAAGKTSTAFAFTSSGVLPLDHTYPGIAQVMVTSPNTVFSPRVKPAGACVVPVAFQVTSVSMAVTPTSITGLSCGTSLTVTYTATFHLAASGPGGIIHFAYTVNNGRSSTPASLAVAPGQTTASYTFVWSDTLPADHTYPGPGGVMVKSPSAINSPMLGPSGMCRS